MASDRYRERVADAFATQAERFDAPGHTLTDPNHLEWAIDRLSLPASALVVDVATGTGQLAGPLRARGHRVVGVDPTPAMLARAAAKHDPPEPVLGEVERLPFRSGDADVVTCCFGLHHFADPGTALREMVRVCRTGGIVGVVELAAPDLTALAHIYNRYERLRDPSHVLARSVGGLRRLLRDAGLDVNYVETRNVPVTGPMARPDVAARPGPRAHRK